MVPSLSENTWMGRIPASKKDSHLQYYIFASYNFKNNVETPTFITTITESSLTKDPTKIENSNSQISPVLASVLLTVVILTIIITYLLWKK
jgi:uncharacterized Zn-finger protein